MKFVPGQEVIVARGIYATVLLVTGTHIVVKLSTTTLKVGFDNIQTFEEYSRWLREQKEKMYDL